MTAKSNHVKQTPVWSWITPACFICATTSIALLPKDLIGSLSARNYGTFGFDCLAISLTVASVCYVAGIGADIAGLAKVDKASIFAWFAPVINALPFVGVIMIFALRQLRV